VINTKSKAVFYAAWVSVRTADNSLQWLH